MIFPDYTRDVWTVHDLTDRQLPCVRCGIPTSARDRATGAPTHLFNLQAFDCSTFHKRRGIFFDQHPAAPTTATPRTGRTMDDPFMMRAASRIAERVTEAVTIAEGDMDVAKRLLDDNNKTSAVIKQAIGDFFDIWQESRASGALEYHNYLSKTGMPDILRKKTQQGQDEIWEGRPKWHLAAPVQGDVERLDTNCAYVGGLNTHVPLTQLQHRAGDVDAKHIRERAGLYLLDPPAWHVQDFPSPIGTRTTPGPVWITRPTLETLIRAHGLGMCDRPTVLESWTSLSSGALFDVMRRAVVLIRGRAIENDDPLTVLYLKAMYSKFVSTCGQSQANPYVRRPDWMHTFRARAYSNLWLRGLKARENGLAVVAMTGTDELHVIGDWRGVWEEGRGPAQMKIKA